MKSSTKHIRIITAGILFSLISCFVAQARHEGQHFDHPLPVLPDGKRIIGNADNSRIALFKLGFPMAGAVAITGLCALPMAYFLYERWSTPKTLLTLDAEGIHIYGKTIRWEDLYALEEIRYKDIEFVVIRTENDEKIEIPVINLPIGTPKFLKLVNHYWSQYKNKKDESEELLEFPKLEPSKLIDVSRDQTKTTLYKAKPTIGTIALMSTFFMFSLPFWIMHYEGKHEHVVFEGDELRVGSGQNSIKLNRNITMYEYDKPVRHDNSIEWQLRVVIKDANESELADINTNELPLSRADFEEYVKHFIEVGYHKQQAEARAAFDRAHAAQPIPGAQPGAAQPGDAGVPPADNIPVQPPPAYQDGGQDGPSQEGVPHQQDGQAVLPPGYDNNVHNN